MKQKNNKQLNKIFNLDNHVDDGIYGVPDTKDDDPEVLKAVDEFFRKRRQEIENKMQ